MASAPDPVVERAHEEAKEVVETQSDLGESLDAKAGRVLRFDALLLGILATLVTFALGEGPGAGSSLRAGTWVAVGYLAGFLLLVLSAVAAVLATLTPRYSFGLSAADLRRPLHESRDERDHVVKALTSRTRSIETNRDVLDRSVARFRYSLWLLVGSLFLLSGTTVTLMLVRVTL